MCGQNIWSKCDLPLAQEIEKGRSQLVSQEYPDGLESGQRRRRRLLHAVTGTNRTSASINNNNSLTNAFFAIVISRRKTNAFFKFIDTVNMGMHNGFAVFTLQIMQT